MLQNFRVTAFTVSELLSKNQQGSGKTAKTLFFKKKNTLQQSNRHLVPNMYLNIKYEIVHFEKMSNIAICQISFAVNINFTVKNILDMLEIPKIVNYKGSGPSCELEYVFSNNPSQNMIKAVVNQDFFGKFNSCFCLIFFCYCQIFMFATESGHQVMLMLNFEIFLKCCYFLRF